MGLIAESFQTLGALLGATEHKAQAVGSMIPSWQVGVPTWSTSPLGYAQQSLSGYMANELVFACVEELSTSAAEPRLAAYLKGQATDQQTLPKPERVIDHPLLDLFERPNPWLDRFAFWAGVIMHLSVAGNAYIEKVRSAAGGVVELWLLRPDRVHVVPDAKKFIRGYTYNIAGMEPIPLDVNNVLHIKNRHPLDDYYGLAPIAVAMPRIATDSAMRAFTQSFFANGAVPSGILTIKRTLDDAEREMLRQRMRQAYGGAAGWHSTIVLDSEEGADYQQAGFPLGDRGLAMPALDEINEVRIAQVFGVPLTLVGARVGQHSSSYANRVSDRQEFWNETLIPLYRRLAAAVTNGFGEEFDGYDYVEFDMSDVHALGEDEDAKHTRLREDMKSGGITREEFRQEIGYDPEPDKGTWLLPINVVPTEVGNDLVKAELAAQGAQAQIEATKNPPQPQLPPGQAPGDGKVPVGAAAGDRANGAAGPKAG